MSWFTNREGRSRSWACPYGDVDTKRLKSRRFSAPAGRIALTLRGTRALLLSRKTSRMDKRLLREIQRLRQMTVAELRREWERLYGGPTRSRNRDYLWKRLAWRVQELAYGGLSDWAKARIEVVEPHAGFIRARTPGPAICVTREAAKLQAEPERPVRDPRLPSPGTVLTREYHDRELRVLTREDGFEWEGRQYRSLSAVARAVTGQRWNGLLFFGLTKRKRS